MAELYIGLMSGTSLDGVDGVLVDLSAARPRVLQHASAPFPPELRAALFALNAAGANELHHAALAANGLARSYAQVVQSLLESTHLDAGAVRAIGAHGQTVRHRPGEFDGTGYTVQLNQPALLAELTGIDVVADFRSRDVAAGGQGAPLVPAFHHGLFARAGSTVAVLNIGGISNVSVLGADGSVRGWDCGPGNALMDHWCQHHLGKAFDDVGAWAAQGSVLPALLGELLADPYFAKSPPKSTGRDLFNPAWLDARLAAFAHAQAADVQATLAAFTAAACVNDVQREAPGAVQLLVCGGGALNAHLMKLLAQGLPGIPVASTATAGLPPLEVEACAFAWLARQAVHRETGSLAAVTGAAGARVLGAIYPR